MMIMIADDHEDIGRRLNALEISQDLVRRYGSRRITLTDGTAVMATDVTPATVQQSPADFRAQYRKACRELAAERGWWR